MKSNELIAKTVEQLYNETIQFIKENQIYYQPEELKEDLQDLYGIALRSQNSEDWSKLDYSNYFDLTTELPKFFELLYDYVENDKNEIPFVQQNLVIENIRSFLSIYPSNGIKNDLQKIYGAALTCDHSEEWSNEQRVRIYYLTIDIPKFLKKFNILFENQND